MLDWRTLSGTHGAVSREKSIVTRLERKDSLESSVSVKKRRTLAECLRTNFSVCHSQPYIEGGKSRVQVNKEWLSVMLLSQSGDLCCALRTNVKWMLHVTERWKLISNKLCKKSLHRIPCLGSCLCRCFSQAGCSQNQCWWVSHESLRGAQS